jgi:hypothetical protein
MLRNGVSPCKLTRRLAKRNGFVVVAIAAASAVRRSGRLYSSTCDARSNSAGIAQRREVIMQIQAAAISLQGIPFVVVAASLDLVRSSGEADMAIEELQPQFGGAAIVLMAQKDDDSPVYYGDRQLVELLEGVPIDEMPWKEYRTR